MLAEILPGKHPSVRSAGAVCLQTLRPHVKMSNALGRRVEVGGWGRGQGRDGWRLPHPILPHVSTSLSTKRKSIWACEVEDSGAVSPHAPLTPHCCHRVV